MATAPSDRDPFGDVRNAFADLGTSEKAAFVFEATFETIGQALAETGRRAAAALDDLDLDSWFDMTVDVDIDAEDTDEAAPEPAPKKAAPKRPRKTTRKPPAAKKTAGKAAPKRKPPKTDDDA